MPAIDLDSVHLELPTGEEVAAPKAAVESVDLVLRSYSRVGQGTEFTYKQ